MSLNGFSRSLLSLTFVSAICLPTFEASAAGPCKGLEEKACNDQPACTWVSAYSTKNGNNISAYCRSAGSKADKAVNKEEGRDLKTGASDRTGAAADLANNTEEKRG
jgi:hypothetical protein